MARYKLTATKDGSPYIGEVTAENTSIFFIRKALEREEFKDVKLDSAVFVASKEDRLDECIKTDILYLSEMVEGGTCDCSEIVQIAI